MNGKKIIFDARRQTVMNIEAYSFIIKLSDCRQRKSYISIINISQKYVSGNEYHIRPLQHIPLNTLCGLFAKQMAAEGNKQTEKSYFTDVSTPLYRGNCPNNSTKDNITITTGEALGF